MAPHETIPDVYGPGSHTDTAFVPVPQDASRLLQHLAETTPGFNASPAFLARAKFTGQDLPLLPGPLKAQAFSAACHAMIGLTAAEILATRGVDAGDVHVDTDLAALYPATVGMVSVDGQDWKAIQQNRVVQRAGLDVDNGVISKTPMRFRSWAIYPTKSRDENGHRQWFQILSSLDPPRFLATFGLDADDESVTTNDAAYEKIKAVTLTLSARELEHICIDRGYVGQTVLSPRAWRETSYGKALAKHPTINYRQVRGTEDSPAVPLPRDVHDQRPLAGVRVVELSRVIAGPAVGAYLAALGADVIRIQSAQLPDLGFLSVTLQAGKRVADIDLNDAADRAELHALLAGADVVVQGFRLKSLERKGFGLEDVVQMARQRNRGGAVYVDLNCYGPDGYYAERPGYQQIADCGSGCSYINGVAYGLPEGTGVLPSLPIADMLTGAVGALVTLLGIRDRATRGGSYHAHVSLMAMDTAQLTPEFGLYSTETVAKVQETYRFAEMGPQHMVTDLLDIMIRAWEENSAVLTKEERFVEFETQYGKRHRILAPGFKFANVECSPRWEWGPVPNGGRKGLAWRVAA